MLDIALYPQLLAKLQAKTAVIGVIGLGYVGLPLCVAIANSGSNVIGFDIDQGKAEALTRGKSYIKHIGDGKIESLNEKGLFRATSDFSLLRGADAILICVPTPLTAHLEPDLSYVVETGRSIARSLRRGQLVVLESTSYPGTTTDVLRPILEQTGLVCGRDFFLAFSPEREDPGNADFSTARIPKVVGGEGPEALELALALYSNFVVQTVPVSSVSTAEAVKVTENIFRAVNIALVNELKLLYTSMGINIWEVIDAAKTKPFGFMPFYPGPGLGGHCIPIDPYYLVWKAREYGLSCRFIELAGQVNTSMPEYVINQLVLALDQSQNVGLNGSRILMMGVAYKKNIDDIRESPSLRLIDLLEARGALVDFFDPHVPIIPLTREHKSLAGRRSVDWNSVVLARYNAALIATDHDAVDYGALVRGCKLVVDTRNACGRARAFGTNVIAA